MAESKGCHIYNQQLKATFFCFPSDKSKAQSGETMEKHKIIQRFKFYLTSYFSLN